MKVRELTSEEIMSTLELPTAMLRIFDKNDETHDNLDFSDNVAAHIEKSSGQYVDDQYTFMGFIGGDMTIVKLSKERRPDNDWQRVRVIYGDASMVAARLTACFASCGVCASAEPRHYGATDDDDHRLHYDTITFYVFDEELLK